MTVELNMSLSLHINVMANVLWPNSQTEQTILGNSSLEPQGDQGFGDIF